MSKNQRGKGQTNRRKAVSPGIGDESTSRKKIKFSNRNSVETETDAMTSGSEGKQKVTRSGQKVQAKSLDYEDFSCNNNATKITN